MREQTERFPYADSVREKMRFLLRYALLAPSTHNTQPWIFKLNENRVEVYGDTSRSLANIDPDRREYTMSVGAAVDHLRLAMAAHLMEPNVELVSDRDRPDLLAVVTCLGEVVPQRSEREAFEQIGRRHTYRGDFDARAVEAEVKLGLLQEVNDDSAGIVFIEDASLRGRIAQMVRTGSQALLGEEGYRREASQWLRTSRSTLDGIPAAALGLDPVRTVLAPWAMAHSDCGGVKAAFEERQIETAPGLAMVCTHDDEQVDWLLAGMAISRFTLAAAARGLRCSFYLQPVHFPGFRSELKAATGALGCPQIVLRFGYAAEGKGTPRRPLEDVLIERRERHVRPDGGQ